MTKSLQTKNIPLLPAQNMALPVLAGGTGSLEAYIARVNQMPMLSYEEEQALAARFLSEKDIKAARELLFSHLRFVVRIARGYMGYGLPLGDLIQEGNIGLMKAIKRFDAAFGVRLVSFAVHWVKAEIHEFILRNWRIVKIATTKAQRKLFFNLRKSTQHVSALTDAHASNVAQDLQVSKDEVHRMYERLHAHDEAFDGMETDESNTAWAPEHYLEDTRYNPALQLEAQNWTDTREQALQQAMLSLDTRSQDILKRRWLSSEKSTLHTLAAEHQISAERVRQIEKIAMDKLKQVLSRAS
jgi:RNA polymerase sigma-32 factor